MKETAAPVTTTGSPSGAPIKIFWTTSEAKNTRPTSLSHFAEVS